MTVERWNGDTIADTLATKAAAASRAAAELVLREANREVPVDEGELRRSGKVTTNGHTSAVSYGTDHAVIMHESMSADHDGGRSAKFLERAWNDNRARVLKSLALEMKL